MRQREKELESLSVHVKVVTFDGDFMARSYAQDTNLNWPLLLDTNRELYRAYQMERGSWWSISNPLAIFRYVTLILRGWFPGQPGRDLRQMGGDVVVDPAGIIRLHHVSCQPHDRPSIETLLTLVSRSREHAD